jgi:hypothetical protein
VGGSRVNTVSFILSSKLLMMDETVAIITVAKLLMEFCMGRRGFIIVAVL